jgi:hypothetical protein
MNSIFNGNSLRHFRENTMAASQSALLTLPTELRLQIIDYALFASALEYEEPFSIFAIPFDRPLLVVSNAERVATEIERQRSDGHSENKLGTFWAPRL